MTRQITTSIGLAALIIAVAAGLTWAKHQGFLGADAPVRWTMVLTGIVLAFNANLIPKQGRPVCGRLLAMRRMSGWAMTLSGLGYAAAWAFTPLKDAANLSVAAVAAGIVWVLGFSVWMSTRPKAAV